MIKKEDLNRTVFVSNISFDTTQKTLQEHMKKFGPYKFCLLCMDKVLNRSKGTAFVKFEERVDAEKCIASLQAGELTLDGKVLINTPSHCFYNRYEGDSLGHDGRWFDRRK